MNGDIHKATSDALRLAAPSLPAPDKALRQAIVLARKQVRIERLAAEAARKVAASTVPPSRARWSRRPMPAKVPSEIEQTRLDRAELQRANRARARPDVVAAETQLQIYREETEKRWDHKRHGTPPTLEHAARTQTGPLARLWLSGGIDADQLAAAVDIATVAEAIARNVTVRTASLETRIDAGRHGDGSFFERLGAVRREVAYGRWRKALGPSAAPVLAMIVGDACEGGVGYSVVAKRYRMRPSRARTLLIDALDLWGQEMRRARDWIDETDVRIAHARLA